MLMMQSYIADIEICMLWRNVYSLTWMLWLLGILVLIKSGVHQPAASIPGFLKLLLSANICMYVGMCLPV